jgi:hypothetical protein
VSNGILFARAPLEERVFGFSEEIRVAPFSFSHVYVVSMGNGGRTRRLPLDRLDVLVPEGRIVGIGRELRHVGYTAVDENSVHHIDIHGLPASHSGRPRKWLARSQLKSTAQ